MPTISPQVRPQISAITESLIPRRATITQATGMQIEKAPTAVQTNSEAKTGQLDTSGGSSQVVSLSPQLTALARKQRDLQKEIEAQRAKESQWEKERGAYVRKEDIKTRLQANAAEVLSELGTSYEELTNLLLAQESGDTSSQEIAELRKELERIKNSQKEAVDKQMEATINQYRREAKDLITKDPTKFALINKKNLSEAVVQHIVDTWEEDNNNVMSVEQSANEVEGFLREEAREYKEALDALNAPAADSAQNSQKTLPPPQRSAARTLTQSLEGGAPTRTTNQFQHMSAKERLQAALQRAQR